MPLIFDSFANSVPSSASSFYAHVLTTAPIGVETIVNGLTLASPVGYNPIDLIVTTTTSGTATNWDFDDINWPSLPWTVGLVGVAVIFRVGGTKNPAVDRPFLFFEFENGLHAPIVLTPGYFGVKFSSGTGVALVSQPSTKYDVGGFTGYPLFKDLLTLLNSNNGTRYTPGGVYVANQFFSSTFGGAVYNLDPSCYWIGDRLMVRELQNRHDIGYNNITFPTLPAPVLGFNTAATFNGVDSYVTLGNTTLNGNDFTAGTGTGNQQLFLFYFYPTLSGEEILLDTTTSNNSGGYVVRKTAANKIELMFITAGTPHTAVSIVSSNLLDLNAWNLVLFGSYTDSRRLYLNSVQTSLTAAGGWTAPALANGIRLGARRGLNASLTGANFTGKFLYYMSGIAGSPSDMTTSPILVNRNAQLPYNPLYATGWSQTGLNTTAEMTTPNNFPANKSTFLKSVGNLDTYIGASNMAVNEDLSAINIYQPNCFYVNFGRNKARVGTVGIVFFNNGSVLNVKFDTAANSAVLSIWATNVLPSNTPTNANLINPNLWDKYELTINNINNTGSRSDVTNLPVTASGGYNFHLVNTGISKYYKYYRVGWKNAVAGTTGSSVRYPAHYLLFNSSVLSADLDLIPPIAGYSA
jgi:hypothetical protein